MSRSRQYQRLLNAHRWKQVRARKLQQNPLCERCAAEGYTTAAVDVHNILPLEVARTDEEMVKRCYEFANLKSLCVPYHAMSVYIKNNVAIQGLRTNVEQTKNYNAG